MPIEIRELHIRVSVSPPSDGPPAGAPTPEAGEGRTALVAECVEQVLQVLRDRKER